MKNRLTIIGLGTGDENYLTLGAVRALENADLVIVDTLNHPALPYLKRLGIDMKNLNEMNNMPKTFDQGHESVIEYVLGLVKETNVVIALSGGLAIGEQPFGEIVERLEELGLKFRVIPALPEDYSDSREIGQLENIVSILRSPKGCPWDRAQTHDSLKECLLEETYEVLDAIERKDVDNLIEELGDLMLQIVFHSQIAEEMGQFYIGDVIDGICHKMISRHPHVFRSSGSASGSATDWEAIKMAEKDQQSYTHTLRTIPKTFPGLLRAKKVQKKASVVGFDWDRVQDAFAKLEEEVLELKEVYVKDRRASMEELGDVLFAAVNVARFLDLEPELALNSTIEKFIERFNYIEKNSDKKLEDMSLEEMDKLWDIAKGLFDGD